MDGIVQAMSLPFVSDFTAGHIRAGVHTRHVGAETIEIHSEIVAGVKGSEASIQCREWRTRVGSVGVSGQQTLGLEAGGELFLYGASASGASVELLESFLTHLIGLMECELSSATADAPAPEGPCAAARSALTVKEIEDTEKQDCANKKRFFHTCSFD